MSPDAAIVAMQQISRSLRQLSSVPARASKAASAALQAVVEEQHTAESDPYGQPWAPLKPSTIERKGGDARILRRSDLMLDSERFRPASGAGVTVTLDAGYAAFHQIGTKNMVARPILPRAGLPPAWRDAITDALDNAFRDWAKAAP